MNKEIVLASCETALECVAGGVPFKDEGLQLQLGGYVDIFRKAVSDDEIQGKKLEVNCQKLAEISATVLGLTEYDSQFEERSPQIWQALKALRPAVNEFTLCN